MLQMQIVVSQGSSTTISHGSVANPHGVLVILKIFSMWSFLFLKDH